MKEAPKEIVASVDFEILYGKRIKMSCVTVGTSGVPDPFEPTHYVMKETHDALVKAYDELAAALSEAMPEIDDNCFYCNDELHNSLATHKKARGETQ